jgi:hypothetical protein
MPRRGHLYTPLQRENCRQGHLGQRPWNTGTGGCKRGHDAELWIVSPSGVALCLGCKRENGARYRQKNKASILFKSRIARYNLSPAAFTALWTMQEACCAICHAPFEGTAYRIDHDHTTGEVRGILCVSCNTGIGLLKDSPMVLRHAARYLTRPPAEQLPEEAMFEDQKPCKPQQLLFFETQ